MREPYEPFWDVIQTLCLIIVILTGCAYLIKTFILGD